MVLFSLLLSSASKMDSTPRSDVSVLAINTKRYRGTLAPATTSLAQSDTRLSAGIRSGRSGRYSTGLHSQSESSKSTTSRNPRSNRHTSKGFSGRYLLSAGSNSSSDDLGYIAASLPEKEDDERTSDLYCSSASRSTPRQHTTAAGRDMLREEGDADAVLSVGDDQQSEYSFADQSQLSHSYLSDRADDYSLQGDHSLLDASRYPQPSTPVDKGHPTLWPLLDELTKLEKELAKEASRLRERFSTLKSREEHVLELEQLACRSHDQLAECAEKEVSERWRHLEQERRTHTQGLLNLIKTRDGDVRRLEVSFSAMKDANDALKEKLSHLEVENSKLVKALSSSQRRLKNLQVHSKMQERQKTTTRVAEQTLGRAKQDQIDSKVSRRHRKSNSTSASLPVDSSSGERFIEPFCSLLEWIVDAQLMQPWKKIQNGPMKITPEEFQMQCARLLPLVVELLTMSDVSTTANQIIIPCLRFTLLASRFITHATVSSTVQSQRASLLMMFRHLGEAIAHAKDPGHGAILESASWHVQILASLFVLANVNRTDLVLQAFDVLRNSLRNAVQKNTFLNHQGMAVVVTFMRSSTAKALVSAAVDVHLHLVNEQAVLDRFLRACSSDDWFHSAACLLRDHRDFIMAEKLSIVLQKLAQEQYAHRYFVSHQLVPIAEQLIRSCGIDHTFLVLNLRSVISSVTAAVKEQPRASRRP